MINRSRMAGNKTSIALRRETFGRAEHLGLLLFNIPVV
jgi:hypothetical protein